MLRWAHMCPCDTASVDACTLPPLQVENFLHRSGRTGRAGKTGTTIAFFSPREGRYLKSIMRETGVSFYVCCHACRCGACRPLCCMLCCTKTASRQWSSPAVRQVLASQHLLRASFWDE